MARALPPHEELETFTLEEQLQNLNCEELLDFWEESQLLDMYLDSGASQPSPAAHYEQAVLLELQRRVTMGRL